MLKIKFKDNLLMLVIMVKIMLKESNLLTLVLLQTQFRVLPSQECRLYYNFFPLVAGQVLLPRLHLDMMRYPGTMDEIISKMLPTHIFIRVKIMSREANYAGTFMRQYQ